MNLIFKVATEEDIPILTELMTLTFDDDTQKHLGEPKGGPPDYDTEEFFYPHITGKKAGRIFKIVLNGQIIGSILILIFEHGNNYLARINIDPAYQDKRIGTKAWQFIEETYPQTKSWRTDTPSWAKRNHHFYEKKCGFKKIKEESIEGEGTLFIYRKEM